MVECNPEDWFLKRGEKGGYVNWATAFWVVIPEDQLLAGRAAWWRQQNVKKWRVLDTALCNNAMYAAFTSGNKVTPCVDGDAYVTSLAAYLNNLAAPPTSS